ncbi:MAG: 30S ribosomal protein S16 [Patescibacteria group bacterium]
MIRFQRIGRRNDPAFRIAVLEKSSGPKAGKYVELVGTYNPKTKDVNVKGDAIKAWMAKGAQVSPSVMNLLVSQGVMEGSKVAVVSKKNLEKNVAKKKAEEEAAAAKAEADAKAAEDAKAAAEAAPAEEVAAQAEAPTEAPTEETPAAEEAAPAEEAPAPEETTDAPAADAAPEEPAA